MVLLGPGRDVMFPADDIGVDSRLFSMGRPPIVCRLSPLPEGTSDAKMSNQHCQNGEPRSHKV